MERNRTPLLIVPVALLAVASFGAGCDQRPSTPSTQKAQSAALVPLTNMARITAGSFNRMKQRVTITRDYWLGKFEVTQAEYSALTGNNPSHFTDNPNRPVEKISHADAVAYCTALTRRERAGGRLPPEYEYRLPSEAEWEYACRAGSTNFFSFGDDAGVADQFAWTEENSDGSTHPVGQKQPNPWGLYDMHGNVWEWCHDWFAEFSEGEVTDPVGPGMGKYKVFRGGGWDHEVKFAGVANRFMMPPANGIYFVGFRLALGVAESPSR